MAQRMAEMFRRQAAERLAACQERQQRARQAVRGLGDDYHPFDAHSGQPLEAAEVQERLEQRVAAVEQVVAEASLGERGREAVSKSRRWLVLLAATLSWYWAEVRRRIAALELSSSAERAVYQQLLPGLYWQAAAERGRDAEQRQRLRQLFRPSRRVIGREVEDHVGIVGIADAHPEVRLLGLGEPQHTQLDSRVVAVQHTREQKSLVHQLVQGVQQLRRTSHPVAQSRARDADPGATQLPGQAEQRDMVGELGGDGMRQKTGATQRPSQRPHFRWPRRLHPLLGWHPLRVAVPASVALLHGA